MLQKPRGTTDILPGESEAWQETEAILRKTASLYGFSEVRIPTFEVSELYQRGVGETSDVVQKEMYTFVDNDRRSMTLRPEGTAGVVRCVIENGLTGGALPLALSYFVTCFRYEKPESGRFREFSQFGVELFGADAPVADANVILLGRDLFRNLGIRHISLEINSIGCKACRPLYREALHTYFSPYQNQLCDTCLGRLETNPLRIVDCKSELCSQFAKDAPRTIDHLCPDCHAHFEAVKACLDAAGVEYTVNPRIVRGLDYYQRTVFEFISTHEAFRSTLCGGGRYDGLVEELGGPAVSGVGFATGINRLILAMKAEGNLLPVSPSPLLYIAALGPDAQKYAFSLAAYLREKEIFAAFDQTGRSLKAQMKYADKKNAAFTLIVGDGELEKGEAFIKNMETGVQTPVNLKDFAAIVTAIGKEANR